MLQASRKQNGPTYYYYKRLLRIAYPKEKEELMNVSRNYMVFVDWDDRSVTMEPMSAILKDMNGDDLRRLVLKTVEEKEMARIHSLLSTGPYQKDQDLAQVFRPKEDGEPLPEMSDEERRRMVNKTKPATGGAKALSNRSGSGGYEREDLSDDSDYEPSGDYARGHRRHLDKESRKQRAMELDSAKRDQSRLHRVRPTGTYPRGDLPAYHESITPFGFKMDNVLLWRDESDHEVVQTLVPLTEVRDLEDPFYFELSQSGKVLHNTLTAADKKWEPMWRESVRAIPINDLLQGNDNHRELRNILRLLQVDFVSFTRGDGGSMFVQFPDARVLRINEELYYNFLTRSPAVIPMLRAMGFTEDEAGLAAPLEKTRWALTSPVVVRGAAAAKSMAPMRKCVVTSMVPRPPILASAGLGGASAGLGGASAGLGGASAGLGGASARLDSSSARLDSSSAGLGGASAGLGGASARLDSSSARLDSSSAGLGGASAGLGGASSRGRGAMTSLASAFDHVAPSSGRLINRPGSPSSSSDGGSPAKKARREDTQSGSPSSSSDGGSPAKKARREDTQSGLFDELVGNLFKLRVEKDPALLHSLKTCNEDLLRRLHDLKN